MRGLLSARVDRGLGSRQRGNDAGVRGSAGLLFAGVDRGLDSRLRGNDGGGAGMTGEMREGREWVGVARGLGGLDDLFVEVFP